MWRSTATAQRKPEADEGTRRFVKVARASLLGLHDLVYCMLHAPSLLETSGKASSFC